MEEVTFGLAFIAGLLSFVSPCVLPLVPAYVGYMSSRATRNVSLEKHKNSDTIAAKPSRTGLLLHGLAFVLGFTTVFVVLGLMVTGAAQILGSLFQDIIGRVGGIIIIIFGLHFMGALRYLFAYLREDERRIDKVAIATAFGTIAALVAGISITSDPTTTITTTMLVVTGAFAIAFGAIFFGYVGQEDSVFTTLGVVIAFAIFSLWGFIEPVVALPVVAFFVLWLVVRGAFITPKDFWTNLLTQLEVALYSDTRRDMDVKASEGLGGSFTMGVIFSAGWTPCIGPIYGAILGMSSSGNLLQAAPLLAAYSIGLGIPFLLTALAMEGAQGIMRRLQKHMHTLELVTGAFLIFIGGMVASGQMQRLLTSTPEQTAFASRVEECGVDFISGHLNFSDAQSCIGGSLVPLRFDMSTAVFLDEDRTQMTYLINMEQAVTADVLFMSVDEQFNFNIEVLAVNDNTEAIVATSDTMTLLEEDDFVVVDDIKLQADTAYYFVVSNDGSDIDFRFKVVDSNEVELTSDEQNSISSIDTNALTGLNTIESAADANALTVGIDEGDIAPDFTITTLDGAELSLSDLRGQVVLLNFWGTWCAPCRREMPDFQHVFEEYEDEGFTILALAVRDTEDAMREFRDEFGLTFPIALDMNNAVSDEYAIFRQPSTLILDQNGVIVYKNLGIVLEEQIVDVLSTTLVEQ